MDTGLARVSAVAGAAVSAAAVAVAAGAGSALTGCADFSRTLRTAALSCAALFGFIGLCGKRRSSAAERWFFRATMARMSASGRFLINVPTASGRVLVASVGSQ